MTNLKEETSKGMFWGGFVSLLQQILSLGFSIIIVRRLSPAEFGMVGMLTIFTAVATCLQDGGLVWALTNKNNITHVQYSSVFWLNVTISGFIYFILFFCSPLIASYFKHEELIWLSRFVFLGFLFSSFSVVQTAYLFKQIKVKERAIATLIGLIIAGIAGVILAYNGFSYWGIAMQGILNVGITTFVLWLLSPFRPDFKIDWKFLKDIIPEGLKFVVPNIFSIVGDNIFSVILGKRYSVQDVGNFAQASKWNTAGYSIILGMMRNVSQPVLVQVRDDDERFLAVFRKLFRMTAFLVVPVTMGLAMIAPEFIELSLTLKWIDAAPILRVLCFGGCVCVLNTLLSYFIMSLNRTRLYMVLGVLMSFLQVVSALIASMGGAISLAYTYSGITILSFLIYYFFVRQTHSYKFSLLIKDLFPVFFVTAISISLSYYSTIVIDSLILRFCLKIVIALIVYLVLMQLLHNDSFLEVKRFIVNKFL
jgi:O-antigen/teichoic acid export membrane protein